MNNEELMKLCVKLIKTEKEAEVVDILKKEGYWNDYSQWRNYGDIENNFSIIGNQQSTPESALVEKLVNSIDAVLIKESLARGIHPQSPEAPKSVKDAVRDFFHVYGGSISNIDTAQRNRLAEQIEMVATGYKSRPTFTIIDDGEGQYPEDFHDTFLSLAKSNKIKINFVQGKFNMGGSGVLQFCGKHNLQLIVSRKNTKITQESDWGFTIVRRQQPKAGYKSSTYTYLAPEGNILSFKADSLPVRPSKYPNAYGEAFDSGTLIKLYEYDLAGGLKSNLKFDLFYKLNELLPELALPVRMFERRQGYKGVTMQVTLNGLKTRLVESKSLEEGFPSSFTFDKIRGELYVFKEGTAKNYVSENNIIFAVNGQAHGSLSKRFFNRKNVGMGALADTILVLLNCNEMSPTERENLFMNSRDRLRYSKIRSHVEAQLEEYIANHQGLKDLRQQRRNEKIKENIEQQKPFREAMQEIIGHSKVLSSLFFGKGDLKNPLKLLEGKPKSTYTGKKFPTFFNLITDDQKDVRLGTRFRIQYTTDAENNYLTRENERGEFFLYYKNTRIDCAVNLWNGYATVNIELPEDAKVDDVLKFRTEVWDNSRYEPFEDSFTVRVIPKREVPVPDPDDENKVVDSERKPPVEEGGKSKETPFSGTAGMPNIVEVTKDDWGRYGFKKDDCLEIINNGELGFDFAINMDNQYILSELLHQEDVAETKLKYKYVVSIIGMALIRANKEQDSREITRVLSPVLIPITNLSLKSYIE